MLIITIPCTAKNTGLYLVVTLDEKFENFKILLKYGEKEWPY